MQLMGRRGDQEIRGVMVVVVISRPNPGRKKIQRSDFILFGFSLPSDPFRRGSVGGVAFRVLLSCNTSHVTFT